MVGIRLRRATLDDVEVLDRWEREPHVIAATGGHNAIDWRAELAREVPWYEALVAELDGRPLGVVQIIDPALDETHYWGDVELHQRALDIWIGDAADMGRGYGTDMMTIALDRCFEPPDVTGVLIDPLVSNTDSHRFYQRLGFVPLGEQVLDDDRCLVHHLDRTTWLRLRHT